MYNIWTQEDMLLKTSIGKKNEIQALIPYGIIIIIVIIISLVVLILTWEYDFFYSNNF